jgi:hypothetical protein
MEVKVPRLSETVDVVLDGRLVCTIYLKCLGIPINVKRLIGQFKSFYFRIIPDHETYTKYYEKVDRANQELADYYRERPDLF